MPDLPIVLGAGGESAHPLPDDDQNARPLFDKLLWFDLGIDEPKLARPVLPDRRSPERTRPSSMCGHSTSGSSISSARSTSRRLNAS